MLYADLVASRFPPLVVNDFIQVQENIKYYIQDCMNDARLKFTLLPNFAKLIIVGNLFGWILWKVAPQWMKKNACNFSSNIKSGRLHTLLFSSFSNTHLVPTISNMLFFQNAIKPLVNDLGEPFNILFILVVAIGSNLLQALLHKFTNASNNYPTTTEGFSGVNIALLYWVALMRPDSQFTFHIPHIFPRQQAVDVVISPKNLLLWTATWDAARLAIDWIFGGTVSTSNRLAGLVIGVGIKVLACKFDWARQFIRWNKRSFLCRPVLAKELF